MAFASIDFFFRVKSYTGALVSCYGKFILLFDLVSSQPCFCFSTRRPSPYWTTDGIAKKVNNKPRSLNNNSNRANFSNGPAIIITRASPKMVKQKKNSNVFWLYSTFPKTIGRVGVRSQMVLRPCVILSGQGGSNDPIVRAEPPVIVGCLYARLDQPSETDSSSSFSSSSFYSSTCLSFFFLTRIGLPLLADFLLLSRPSERSRCDCRAEIRDESDATLLEFFQGEKNHTCHFLAALDWICFFFGAPVVESASLLLPHQGVATKERKEER